MSRLAGTWTQLGQDLRGFFQDSRGQFTIFSVVSLCAGLTLCSVVVIPQTPPPAYVVYSLLAIYMVSVLSDSVIALVIEYGIGQAKKAPDTVIDQTGDISNNLNTKEPPASE